MYVREVHRPTRMMVSVDSPASFNAMAPPDLRLWDDTRLRVYPRLSKPSADAPHLTAMVMSRSDTRVGCCELWNTMLMGHDSGPCLILCTRLASAATGQR